MPIVWKHTFYTVKCMFFTILEWYFKIPRLKLKPQSQKHTFYTVKCMFFSILEWNFKVPSKPEIEAPESKTYILHCKMYVFSILEWNFKITSLELKPQSQKHTFYTVTCMFFQFWNEISRFQTWNLKPQSQKHTFYTVKCMFFQFWNEISRFQAWNWSPKVKNIHFTL